MPNIKSAIKRVAVSEKKTLRNRMVKSKIKTALKRFDAAVEANDLEKASGLLPIVSAELDKAASKGIVHRNYADRNKSRLAVKLNKTSTN
ncbi:MAG TPA: 30S ribosomal protein S20 [Clostridia bacterium]|nr:30S ribosomal protein S20 [Clostridia bacterium]